MLTLKLILATAIFIPAFAHATDPEANYNARAASQEAQQAAETYRDEISRCIAYIEQECQSPIARKANGKLDIKIEKDSVVPGHWHVEYMYANLANGGAAKSRNECRATEYNPRHVNCN